MPLYNFACRQALSNEVRQEIAKVVTFTHCERTGAPSKYVNVIFLDGYPLPAHQTVSMYGTLRSGGNRTQESKLQLERALQEAVANVLDEAPEAVGMNLIGLPYNWVVEGGELMPEPGKEEELAVGKS